MNMLKMFTLIISISIYCLNFSNLQAQEDELSIIRKKLDSLEACGSLSIPFMGSYRIDFIPQVCNFLKCSCNDTYANHFKSFMKIDETVPLDEEILKIQVLNIYNDSTNNMDQLWPLTNLKFEIITQEGVQISYSNEEGIVYFPNKDQIIRLFVHINVENTKIELPMNESRNDLLILYNKDEALTQFVKFLEDEVAKLHDELEKLKN